MAKNKNKNVQNIKGNNIPEKVNDIVTEKEKKTTPNVNINNENGEVTNKNQEIKVLDSKDNDGVNIDDKDSKENDKEVIKVLDNNNKPISEDIENEEVKDLGIKKTQKQPQTRNSKLKKAKNGEYYEAISEDMGMWSRTGEVFRLIDLD